MTTIELIGSHEERPPEFLDVVFADDRILLTGATRLVVSGQLHV